MDRLEAASQKAEDHPDDPGVWLELAAALLEHGAVDPARHVGERARACDPTTAEHWCRLGELHLRLGDRAAGLEALRAATVLDPEHDASARRFAEVAIEAGLPDEAEEVLRRSLERHDDPELRSRLALALEARGQHEGALAEVERALEGGPGADEQRLLLAARLARRLERDDVEERVLRALSELRPDDPRVAIRWARIQMKRGRADLAHAELVRVARKPGLNVDDREELGWLFLDLDDPESALVQMQLAVDAAPQRASARLGWGECLERDGQLEAAADAYARAQTLDPELLGVHARRGRVLARLERHREAVEAFIRASGERPDDDEIRGLLARSLLASGHVTTTGAGAAGLSGDLSVFRLEEILEFLGVQRATGELHIASTNREATIRLARGRIVDVAWPARPRFGASDEPTDLHDRERRVVEGVRALLSWGDGQVRFRRSDDIEPSTPGFEHQLVLMSIMKSIDEGDR